MTIKRRSTLRLLMIYLRAQWFRATYPHLDRDVSFHPEMDVGLDVYAQPEGAGHPVLFFIHGGRWKDFSKDLFAPVAMKLLPEEMVVVLPDHTLHPHARYEQMAREVGAALSWVIEHAARYGGDPGRVVVAGHSSGAHLAALAVMDPRFMTPFGHSVGEVCGFTGISGAYDLEAQYAYERSIGSQAPVMTAVTGGREHFAAASPITHVRADLPPFRLIHGSADRTVPVEISSAFHRALQAAGAQSELLIYPGRGHSELLISALSEDRPRLLRDVSAFVHGCGV